MRDQMGRVAEETKRRPTIPWAPCRGGTVRHESISTAHPGKHFPQSDLRDSQAFYFWVNAATPGSSTPPRNSSDAPPPVEMWEILSATPADLTAFSESPPPTTLTAPDDATALASATVPLSNGGISKTPIGPFQMMVFAPAITLEYASMVLGPMSRPILPSGTRSTTWFSAPALSSDATT